MFGSGRPNWTTPPTSFHLSNIEGADLKQEQATQTEVLQTPSGIEINVGQGLYVVRIRNVELFVSWAV